MDNLILNQKFLNERKRTINIFAAVCVLQFCSIAFYLVSIVLFENFVIHNDLLNYNFSKGIAKLSSGSARTSARSLSIA